MPTYAYACTACDHAFDIQQSFSDDSLTICPECEGKLRKIFSSVGVSFKGSGFYATDSRAPEKKSSSTDKSSSGDKSDSGSTTSSSSDSSSSGTKSTASASSSDSSSSSSSASSS